MSAMAMKPPEAPKDAPRPEERKHPPVDDAPGTDAPGFAGFAGEGARTELGDGSKPIDPEWRKRFAEHNREVDAEARRRGGG